MKVLKNIFYLLSPILLFAILYVPYLYLNQTVISDWLGCPCSEHKFNANTFTYIFWYFIAVCAIIISYFASKKVMNNKIFIRLVYILLIIVFSIVTAYFFIGTMMLK